MSVTYYPPLIYKEKTHRPLGTNEFVDPNYLPISARSGNQIQVVPDGLYDGPFLLNPNYYVSSAGADTPTNGTKAQPYKTLDYALAQLTALSSGQYFTKIATVCLKAGETFTMNASFVCGGVLQFAFYGDPNYGDFDGPKIGSPGAYPAVMTDLQRPIIKPAYNSVTDGIFGCVLAANPLGAVSKVQLTGVRVDLPSASPSPGGGDFNDFCIGYQDSTPQVDLLGAIINITDTAAHYGLFGMHIRSRMATLNQFASQFWVNGGGVGPGAPSDMLLARQWFIKFYKDYAGNNQQSNSLVGGSPGSAVLQLNWSEPTSMPVIAGKTNLATYPTVSDPGVGLRNYFYNLNRDQQSRPINVLCGSATL